MQMTRIDFYVIEDDSPDAMALTACRLVEKAYGRGHRVYLHCESEEQARALDKLLWTFRENSFVPHQIYGSQGAEVAPVLVGFAEDPRVEPEVLVNLTPTVPPFFDRFERLAEIVGANPDARARSRTRFRHYSEQGYALQTHHL
jgi:DNA polymerase-3 subunit chi